MSCSAQALVTLVKARLRFSRFPKEPELSRRARRGTDWNKTSRVQMYESCRGARDYSILFSSGLAVPYKVLSSCSYMRRPTWVLSRVEMICSWVSLFSMMLYSSIRHRICTHTHTHTQAHTHTHTNNYPSK
ncbi:hypothetical protein EYF80_062833 [Liparis tanakae]|uniref:Uncharacterized protein n=1 Tax=Liparis tanakae TaxID=230148 RepID=A0A4Z2EEV5_9TELE|nr:hypothetical protein EYF80_062833 [Liparis tanakae]